MPPAEYARSGFHSGQTASGYFDEAFGVSIGGVDRTKPETIFESVEITETLGGSSGPNQAVLDVTGFAPSALQEIRVFNGGIDVGVPLFCGHLQTVDQDSSFDWTNPTFHLVATDYTWLLDRYALVTKTYRRMGVSTIVGDVLYNFTDGGFVPGYLPQSLGDIEAISFTQARVSDVLQQLADVAHGQLRLGYNKSVSIHDGVDIDSNNDLSIGTVNPRDFWAFRYVVDPSQWRTRVIREGGGSATTVVALAGATEVAVDEIGWYNPAGGQARASSQIFTYSGVSASSGPGALLGCSGIAEDIAQGDSVYIMATADNPTAQAILATILGGGLSGIAVDYQANNSLGLTSITALAGEDLNKYSAAQQQITYTTVNPYTTPGRDVAVAVSAPFVINTTLTIQTQRLVGKFRNHAGVPSLERIVTIAPVQKTLYDNLTRAGV